MEIKFQKMLDEIKDKDSVLSFNRTSLKVAQLFSIIRQIFLNKSFQNVLHEISSKYSLEYNINHWNNGIDCEFLEPKKGWKKGIVKIKILLEFSSTEPDEPEKLESPLDEIRQTLNQDKQ
jgi:hypothetical protein